MFPVTIDPTTFANTDNGYDSWVNAYAPNTGYFLNDRLAVGGVYGAMARSFLYFDLSGAPSPTDNVFVKEAHLALCADASSSNDPKNYLLYGVSDGWNYGLTWNNQPAPETYTWPTQTTWAGASCASLDATGWASARMAPTLLGYPIPNHGMELVGDEGDGYSGKTFYSGESWVAPPVLYVTWTHRPGQTTLVSPADQSTLATLTPTLGVSAVTDPDGDTPLYEYIVSTGTDTTNGEIVWDSGWLTTTSAQVPAGALQDGGKYWWTVFTGDGTAFTWPPSAWHLNINQRQGTGQASPYDSAGPVTVNLATGNVVVQAASPSFPTVGGNIALNYTYNSQAASNTGLAARYFNSADLTGPVWQLRRDSTINFNWGGGSPAAGIQTDNFSARWQGYLTAPTSGSWTFGTISDDGIHAWVVRAVEPRS